MVKMSLGTPWRDVLCIQLLPRTRRHRHRSVSEPYSRFAATAFDINNRMPLR
jgi:hypothetical protein